jgi:hypothetical protein
MPTWEQRKAALSGQAKSAFEQAAALQPKTVEKPVEQRGSGMVKQSQPVLAPKPPGFEGAVIARQKHEAGMVKDDEAARAEKERVSRNSQKTVIQSKKEPSKEASMLREKFRQAARREQERGR